ncbi:hypothetical protein Tco_1185667 [Tanacetum coccineum]
MHEKPNTPRSCLRWKPTGRIFKTAGLRWITTGKMFTDSTTMVGNEPLNGLNEDITNPYECKQTLNVSWLLKKLMSNNQVPQGIHKQKQSPNGSQGVKEQQKHAHFDDPCHELLHRVYISHSGLVSNLILQQPCNPPPRDDWGRLFQPMFDEYFNPPTNVVSLVLVAAAPRAVDLADSLVSTSIDQDAPSTKDGSKRSMRRSSKHLVVETIFLAL